MITEFGKWVPVEAGQPAEAVADISYAGDGSFLMDINWDGTAALATISPQA